MKVITGLKIGEMQINFATLLTNEERQNEVKKYKSFYQNKKDSRGNKVKVITIYS